jgi:hypothetical protein
MKQKRTSIKDLIVEYFKNYPNKDISHGPVVGWVESEYMQL